MYFRHLTLALAAAFVAAAAQPQATFEVASVKRNTECGARRGGSNPGTPGRIHLECQTVTGLIMTSYAVFADGATVNPKIPEITGGPAWMATETYDIDATADHDTPFPRMAGPLLRALLEERFHLTLHREAKESAVYFLTVAKTGSKLQPTGEDACVPLDPNHPPAPHPAKGEPLPNYCGGQSTKSNGSTLTFTSHGATLDQFASIFLSHAADRPVLDKTGLTGRYEIQFEFAPQAMAPRPLDPGAPQTVNAADGPSLFDALTSRLGLKLEPGKAPIDVIVIDRLERPTEN